MGFLRQGMPAPLDRTAITAIVCRAVADEIATLDASTPQDPFGIDDPCPFNPAGHVRVRFHLEEVCAHCSKVMWR